MTLDFFFLIQLSDCDGQTDAGKNGSNCRLTAIIKVVNKFTWRIHALSERLLVIIVMVIIVYCQGIITH